MEASLMQYPQGAIVMYTCPFDKKTAKSHGVLPSHPVMILDKQAAGTIYSYNVMCLTTKLDEYFGYKIFLNTLDQRWRRMSLICPERIYQVRRTDLGAILGFAPPSLVEKCKKAFLYQIGATDEIPEYFQENEMAIKYLTAGEGNTPEKPKCYRTVVGSDLSSLNIAAYAQPVAPSTDGLILVKPQFESVDEGAAPIMAPVSEPAENAPKDDKSVKVEPTQESKFDDTNGPSNDAASSSLEIKNIPLTMDIRDRITHREIKHVPYNEEMQKILASFNDDQLYAIWMERISAYRLHKSGIVRSYYYGEQFLQYVRYHIYSRIEKLKEAVNDGSIQLRYLSNAYYLAFRCMDITDIQQIKLGFVTYVAHCKMYGIPFESTFIGESIELARENKE